MATIKQKLSSVKINTVPVGNTSGQGIYNLWTAFNEYLNYKIVPFVENSTDLLAGDEVLLGKLHANMNVDTDQQILIDRKGTSRKFIITKILVTNASVDLDTAVGGFYPAVSKGGTAIVANTQVYSDLDDSTKVLYPTLAVNLNYDIDSIYLSLTTPQGAAATADVFVFGILLPE